MADYVRKAAVIKAMRFFDNPETITAIGDMVNQGVELDRSDPEHPVLKHSGARVKIGEWLCLIDGRAIKLCNSIFQDLYVPVKTN
jgi:hypothetical protein